MTFLVHKPCTNHPFCWDDNAGNHTIYLRQKHVLEALGFPADFFYQTVNLDLNGKWEESGDMFLPTVRELTSILDDSDVSVLVLNGNEDYIVNTPGQKKTYDKLQWRHQIEFQKAEWRTWDYVTVDGEKKTGGEIKQADKLTFVTVDGAGHPSPGDQPESVWSIVSQWLSS